MTTSVSRFIILLLLIFIGKIGFAQTILNKDNKFGLIATDGSYLLEMAYDDIHELLLYDRYKTAIYQYKKDDKYGLYNCLTKVNTGLVIDTVDQGHGKGTYAFKINDLWGFIIEPELHKFDWVMPKYNYITQWSDGFNPFAPDPYYNDYVFKGFAVSMDSLWGYASYTEDKLIIPMQYINRIEKMVNIGELEYVARDYKIGGGYIIDANTHKRITVSDVVMAKQFGEYYADTYFDGNTMFYRIQHLPTAQKIVDLEAKDFELGTLHYQLMSNEIFEVSCEAKRKNPNQYQDNLCIWYNLKTGEEVYRTKTPNCREIKLGYDDDPTAVWSKVTCGGGKSKIIGRLIDGVFVEE